MYSAYSLRRRLSLRNDWGKIEKKELRLLCSKDLHNCCAALLCQQVRLHWCLHEFNSYVGDDGFHGRSAAFGES